jgi:hypothetical protein
MNSRNKVLGKKAAGMPRNRWEEEVWKECRQIAVYKKLIYISKNRE